MLKKCSTNITQNSPPNEKLKYNLSPLQESCQEVQLFPLSRKRQKPQISSIPGTSPKVRNRYRVMLGDVILGEYLSLDEAVNLAKRGES